MSRKPYEWDPSTARFRDPDTGRYISREDVRRAVDDLVRKSQARITTFTNELRAGSLSTTEWSALMKQEIKRTHLATEALLRGGWNQMGAADYGRVGARVKAQYRFLDGFVKQIEANAIPRDGRLMSRARMYAASARIAFHDALGPMLERLGYTEERNHLNPAEHCAGCLDMAALKWVPIGTCIPIGERPCMVNDRCNMLYR